MKTRAERTFHLVERTRGTAVPLHTLNAGSNRFSVFSQLPNFCKGKYSSHGDAAQQVALELSMNILGINAFHGDASAALLADGNLTSAVEEERLNRIKHRAGFPALAIGSCLKVTDARELAHVAISRDPQARLWSNP